MKYLALLFTLFTMGCVSAPKFKCDGFNVQYNQQLRWETLPIKLHIHPELPDEFKKDIIAMAIEWHRATGLVLFEPQISTSDVNNFELKKLKKRTRNGFAKVHHIFGRIYQFSIEIESNRKFDRQSVILHELGHVLGLAHDKSNGNIMNESIGHWETKRVVDKKSVNRVLCMYSGKAKKIQ